MNKQDFSDLIQSAPILLDGATGTHLQNAGMPSGVSSELWVLENRDVLASLQTQYIQAGSQIIVSPTFGANRPKLEKHLQQGQDVEIVNRELAAISCKVRDDLISAVHKPVYVAGDIGPTGQFLFPSGELSFNEMVDIFREQVRGLLAGGVDLFIIETMLDLSEVRAVVTAIHSECDLPIISSLTFESNGRTLSGNSPETCLITLTSMGVDAFGINCSFGPDKLGELIEPLRSISPVPLLLKPNAGLPQLIDGATVFPMNPDDFSQVLQPLLGRNVLLAGGCCGTGPDHIAKLKARINDHHDSMDFSFKAHSLNQTICSSRSAWFAENIETLPIISCTAIDDLIDDAFDAAEDEPPALVLSFDLAVTAEQWPELEETFMQLQTMVALPLILKVSDQALLELLLRHYCGRAGVLGSSPNHSYGALSL